MSLSPADGDPAEMVTAAKLRRAGQTQLAGIYTAGQKGCYLDNGVAVIIGPFGFEDTSVGDAVAGAAD
ncbi:MAG: hypothetical protein OXI27_07560 [Thaumarchaeota archaeon]|nr:hypothetical protein [Nitrososphaerota archaeon]